MVMELDEKNKILFEHLLAHARFSVKDLARILHVSKPAVVKRLRFLEEQKYILRYDAIINWQKMPFIKKVYFVKIEKDKEAFEKGMIAQQPVFSLISLTGLYSYQVWCFFKSRKEELEFEKKLSANEFRSIEITKLVFPKATFFDIS